MPNPKGRFLNGYCVESTASLSSLDMVLKALLPCPYRTLCWEHCSLFLTGHGVESSASFFLLTRHGVESTAPLSSPDMVLRTLLLYPNQTLRGNWIYRQACFYDHPRGLGHILLLPGTQSLPLLRPAGTQGKMKFLIHFFGSFSSWVFCWKQLIFEPIRSAASILAINSLSSYLLSGYITILLFNLHCSSFLPLLTFTLSRDGVKWVKCFHFSGGLRNWK